MMVLPALQLKDNHNIKIYYNYIKLKNYSMCSCCPTLTQASLNRRPSLTAGTGLALDWANSEGCEEIYLAL